MGTEESGQHIYLEGAPVSAECARPAAVVLDAEGEWFTCRGVALESVLLILTEEMQREWDDGEEVTTEDRWVRTEDGSLSVLLSDPDEDDRGHNFAELFELAADFLASPQCERCKEHSLAVTALQAAANCLFLMEDHPEIDREDDAVRYVYDAIGWLARRRTQLEEVPE